MIGKLEELKKWLNGQMTKFFFAMTMMAMTLVQFAILCLLGVLR